MRGCFSFFWTVSDGCSFSCSAIFSMGKCVWPVQLGSLYEWEFGKGGGAFSSVLKRKARLLGTLLYD